jgi:hypothetical protein
MPARFRPGDVVVYRKQKVSVHPGPNARDIQPAPNGDTYSYSVEKVWRVDAVRPDNILAVHTRKGKRLIISANDPNLRPMHWWERLLFWHRLPARIIPEGATQEQSRGKRQEASEQV